jgi:glycosyltransferase involved in cell wall biosynthesis
MLAEYLPAVCRIFTVGVLNRLLRAPEAPAVNYVPIPGRMLYAPASCLPYHVSGYTTRTHEVILALKDGGADMRVLTRPGYPWDRGDRCCETEDDRTSVDDVEYRHLRRPRNNWPVVLYAPLAAKAVIKVAIAERVSVIHAASNHVNALPALLAAKQLGIPFQYEMRGLWELTRVSRQPRFEESQAYKQGLALEGLVARHADRLYVISEQLGKYAQARWRVPVERIILLPNCVTPERFPVAKVGEVESRTIGYAGSLIGYEGLDILIEAMARLKQAGVEVRVRIVGDGEARSDLEALAMRLGVTDRVQFMGRLAPEAAREVIRYSALVCLPRKSYEVCRIVPPIKLVEALAMGKPVIVPDLPVFRDELGPEPAGWFFNTGDAQDLARVIGEALARPDRLTELGVRARDYAVSQRSWQRYVAPMVEVFPG